MRSRALSRVIFTAAILIVATNAGLQAESLNFWAGAGAGPCTLGFGSAQLGASVNYGWAIASVRRMVADDNPIFDGGTTIHETGLLLGVIKRTDKVTFSIEAGVGWVDGRWEGDIYTNEYADIDSELSGVIGSQVIFGQWKHFGLGAYVYANINEYENYGGVHFTVYFGKMRN